MQIGQKICQLRKISGITQEQLAEQLHVSRQTISKWESGATLPDIESVVVISRLFEVSLNDLLLEADDRESSSQKDVSQSLEELARINRRNRLIILVVTGILIFVMGIILGSIFVNKLDNTTSRIEYTLHQYMELEDSETALINTNAKEQVLIVANGTYDDGTGHRVAMACEVYYTVDNKVKSLGTIESAGTAYPIASDRTGIYAASGHSILRYEIDEETRTLVLAEAVHEDFDKDGNVSYEKEIYGVRTESSEEEFMEMVANYGRATVVSFE